MRREDPRAVERANQLVQQTRVEEIEASRTAAKIACDHITTHDLQIATREEVEFIEAVRSGAYVVMTREDYEDLTRVSRSSPSRGDRALVRRPKRERLKTAVSGAAGEVATSFVQDLLRRL